MPFASIRTRLLVLALALLAIPYVGYRYVQEMEGFLRAGLEATLLGGARALAGALHDRPGLFPDTDAAGNDVHAHPLPSALELDGYLSDWGALAGRLRSIPVSETGGGLGAEPPRYAAGQHGEHLYVLLDVPDTTPTAAADGDPLSGDHVVVRTLDRTGQRHHYQLDTSAAGPVHARALVRDRVGRPVLREELRIRGVQRTYGEGYVLELRIPLGVLGARFGLTVVDAAPGADGQNTFKRASTAASSDRLGALVLPSADIAGVIASLGRNPGRRVWVVDRHGRVLARGGSLTRRVEAQEAVPAVFGWILGVPSVVRFADPGPVDSLDSDEVRTALSGATASRWRGDADSALFVVSAAHPIWSQDEVVGAVLVEESSAPIQTARSRALAELFVTTLVVFVIAGLGLALFASSLSRRLRRLNTQAQAAIDRNGRVVGGVSANLGSDEIGELARGVADLLGRLGQYNRYLERLAGRLSHELRTPLAVIRSSLDNLELDGRAEARAEYLDRARLGVRRLQTIITRMSEVARIEEAVRAPEHERFDLNALMAATVAGYRDTWPERRIDWRGPDAVTEVDGHPDLIAQLLDKLVANALDFATPGTAVTIALAVTPDMALLSVTNEGPRLPQDLQGRLFESMVSMRSGAGDGEPHLGLGLYIVRLIAEGHDGRARALQLEAPDRVRFEVELPLAS